MDDFGKRDWLVIRTRPRWEKKVYNQIVKGNINAFLPLITTIKKWSDRKKKVEIPMFNSYIFVNVNKLERQQAIQGTLGAMNYIFYNVVRPGFPNRKLTPLRFHCGHLKKSGLKITSL